MGGTSRCDSILIPVGPKYYKLLNLGVPEEAVRQRMYEDGCEPETLDVDLFRKVQIQMKKEDFQYDEGKDAGIEYLKVSIRCASHRSDQA